MTHPIKTLREAQDLSLRDLATVAGTTNGVVWKYEQGKVNMNVRYLSPIAALFDVPVSALAAPGQAIFARTPEDLDELIGDHEAVSLCDSKDPLGVVASWLGRDINDVGVREWLAEIKETLKETS